MNICNVSDIFSLELVASHAHWKMKLDIAIAKEESLDAELLSRDDCCVLGKWLHDGGKQFIDLQSYRNCLVKHAIFHIEAGKIAECINAQNYEYALQLLDSSTSDFNQTSEEVVSSICCLENDLKEAKNSICQR